jgi:hypothetical protein
MGINNILEETPEELEHKKILCSNIQEKTKKEEIEWRIGQLKHIFNHPDNKIFCDEPRNEYVVICPKLCLMYETDFIMLYRQGFRIILMTSNSNDDNMEYKQTTFRLSVAWGYSK